MKWFSWLKRKPVAPSTNQIFIGEDERHALRQVIEFMDKEEGHGHQGYFHSSHGWCGRTLKGLLDRIDSQRRRWYIRHRVTGLYLGSCHTTGDGIWTNKAHAEFWSTRELAVSEGLNYHPFQRLKSSKVEIVYE